jgi:hypothetical protein
MASASSTAAVSSNGFAGASVDATTPNTAPICTMFTRRLEQIGKTLGIELTEPTGLVRARVALTAQRLLDD